MNLLHLSAAVAGLTILLGTGLLCSGLRREVRMPRCLLGLILMASGSVLLGASVAPLP